MTRRSGDPIGDLRERRASRIFTALLAMCQLASLSAAQNIVLDSEDRPERASGALRTVRLPLSHGETSFLTGAEETGAYTYSHRVPLTGYYRLYLWWPSSSAPVGAAALRIRHGRGVSAFSWTPDGLGARWNAAGVFWLDAAQVVSVEVASPPGARTFVDAIRLELVGDVEPELDVVTKALPVGFRGASYASSFEARDGAPPYAWYLFGDVPPGLSLEPSGVLTGKPLRAGEYDVEIQVVDRLGAVAARGLRLVVTASSTGSRIVGEENLSSVGIDPAAIDADSVGLTALMDIVAALPEGDWVRVNDNAFSDVWTPAELRPLKGAASNPTPDRIIGAWSSFAWDSKRALLVLYGGGHANYSGNDVYFWRGDTRRWERAALPSEITQDDVGNWRAIDGVDAAPSSAHTYDNSVYLRVADRFLTYGGAAYNNGGPFKRQVGTGDRKTGPYSFDPSKADPMKVGGTTGSHVQRVAPHPEVVGGEMWMNRDLYGFLPGASLPSNFVKGATGYVEEGGKDVIYVSARSGGTALALYKHTIRDADDPSSDTFEQVGRYFSGIGDQGAGAHDPVLNVFVRTSGTSFTYWDLSTPGPSNKNVVFAPSDPSGSFALDRNFGMDYDPVRARFVLWGGGGQVFVLTPPAEVGPGGWMVEAQPAPTSDVPDTDVGTGVLGKWKYIPNLDVFMTLQDAQAGNVWLYKPLGWSRPSLPLAVSITAPSDGSRFAEGEDVLIEAEASDPDGMVVRVEFYEGTNFLGEDGSAPYELTWTGVPSGSYALTAVAVDDEGATASSSAVNVTVGNVSPEVELTSPAEGAVFAAGSDITLSAEAMDVDGSVVRVEFYEGTTFLGDATTEPFSFVWTSVPAGSYVLTAVAVDDGDGSTVSTAAIVTVSDDASLTVGLQDGVDGYFGTRDAFISSKNPGSNFGASTILQDKTAYQTLVKFAVFASEGGPIPDGAVIQRATLSLYKSSAYDHTYRVHRLRADWLEDEVTWNESRSGASWASPGASGVGVDFEATPDGEATVAWSSGWIDFDVSAGVQELSAGAPNFGWTLVGISGNGNLKKFKSRESSDITLRPKLIIEYALE